LYTNGAEKYFEVRTEIKAAADSLKTIAVCVLACAMSINPVEVYSCLILQLNPFFREITRQQKNSTLRLSN
jgi:hypothetical protein